MVKKTPDPYGSVVRNFSCEARNLAGALCSELSAINGGRSLAAKVRNLIRKGEDAELISLEINPSDYDCPLVFGRDYQAVSLLSKFPHLNIDVDRAQVAKEKFRKAEANCREVNHRLKTAWRQPSTGVTGVSLLETARYKIAELIGDFSWDRCVPYFSFTGGASTSLPKLRGDAFHKYSGRPDVTRRAALLGITAIRMHPMWCANLADEYGLDPVNWVRIVPGNKLSTVAKNAKTDRVIAVEPDLNMFLQKGIGGVLSECLLKVGIDLSDQGRNQRLAQEAYEHGLSTIDLSAASDSVSYELVRWLMPPDWFEAMDAIRSEVGRFSSGEVVEYQKFSSMGNAFTFELETLIFWALCKSVALNLGEGRSTLAVYGDDIIVERRYAGAVVEILEYVGFTTNVDKSFFSGPFFESCGKHFFKGVDVTPFYIRDVIDSVPRLYWFANSLRRWASRPFDGWLCDDRYQPLWERVVQRIPKGLRFFIPEDVGDVGVVVSFSEASPRHVTLRSGQKHKFRVATGYLYHGIYEIAGRQVIGGYGAVLRAFQSYEHRDPTDESEVEMHYKVQPQYTHHAVRKRVVGQWTSPGFWTGFVETPKAKL